MCVLCNDKQNKDISKSYNILIDMVEHRVSNSQLEELLDYLGSHPNLAKGVGLGARSKETIEKEWGDLAKKLNSHGLGASKSGQRWKRYWIDLKHKVKSRAAARKKEASGTGGGPAVVEDLSEIDKKVLNIIGEGAVYGDTQHRVPVFSDRQSTSSSQNINIKEIDTNVQTVDLENHTLHQESISVQSIPIHSGGNENEDFGRDESEVNGIYTLDIETSELLPVHESVHRNTNQDAGKRKLQQKFQSPPPRRQKIETNWVVELERRRVEAEEKISNAVMIMAEASRTQAEAALVQGNAAKIQAEAVNIQAEAMKAQADSILQILVELKK